MDRSAGVDDRLSRVLWIGGGPCAGKTTLARLLAGTYDLKIYNADWHHVHDHRARLGAVPPSWNELSMDERWLRPSPQQLADRDIANWTGCFPLIIEDLLALPDPRRIVAEGPSVFPWCVAPFVRSSRQAIFLLPTPQWRDRVLERRQHDTTRQPFEDWTSDPERARRNVREREILIGERIAAACKELGLRYLRLDGSLDLDASLALLEEHFRPHLPEALNV
jgi:hypothetical protein